MLFPRVDHFRQHGDTEPVERINVLPIFLVQSKPKKTLTREQALAREMGSPPVKNRTISDAVPAHELLGLMDQDRCVLIYDPEFWYPEKCWSNWLYAEAWDPVQGSISAPLGNQNPEWRHGLDIPPYLTIRGLEKASQFQGPVKWTEGRIVTGHELCVFALPGDLLRAMPETLYVKDIPDYLQTVDIKVRIYCQGWLHNFNALGDVCCRHDLLAMTDDWEGLVLEFGCGSGMMAGACKDKGHRVSWVGVDINPEMLKLAGRHVDLAVMADAERELPFSRHARFNYVVCGDFLEHLSYPWQFLSGLRTVVADNGKLIASVPNIGHWSVVEDLLAGRFDEAPAGVLCVTHLRFGTKKTWARWLARAGWRLVKWEEERVSFPENWRRFLDACSGLETEVDSLETFRYRFVAMIDKS